VLHGRLLGEKRRGYAMQYLRPTTSIPAVSNSGGRE
jgi:hypothetical protein